MIENADACKIAPAKNRPTWPWLAAWLVLGLVCILFDPVIQPYLTRLGQVMPVRVVAKHWQELGATTGIVLFLLAAAGFAWHDRGRTLVRFGVGLAAAGLAVQVLKHVVGRVRPNDVGDASVFVGPNNPFTRHAWQLDSMPSGHATAVFAMAGMLAWRWPRLRWLWFFTAAGVAASRVLVDRHFPSDVLLGAWLGVMVSRCVNNRWPNVTKDHVARFSCREHGECGPGNE